KLLDLVEVLRVVGTDERVRAVGAERLCARDEEWQHVPDPRRWIVCKVRRCRPPDTWRWRVQVRRRSEPSIVYPRFEHCPGCRLADRDSSSSRSGWVVGQVRYVSIVLELQCRQLRREQAGGDRENQRARGTPLSPRPLPSSPLDLKEAPGGTAGGHGRSR